MILHGGSHEPTRGLDAASISILYSDAPRARLTIYDDLNELRPLVLSRRRRVQSCGHDSDLCDWTDLPTVTCPFCWLNV